MINNNKKKGLTKLASEIIFECLKMSHENMLILNELAKKAENKNSKVVLLTLQSI